MDASIFLLFTKQRYFTIKFLLKLGARNSVWGAVWYFLIFNVLLFWKYGAPPSFAPQARLPRPRYGAVNNSFGLRGANAPVHPLWLCYCNDSVFTIYELFCTNLTAPTDLCSHLRCVCVRLRGRERELFFVWLNVFK